jgi:ferredoxin
MEITMEVKVDGELCVGCETCVDICPEIFEMEDNIAIAKVKDVPEELQESCREAADSCGVEAIIIEF